MIKLLLTPAWEALCTSTAARWLVLVFLSSSCAVILVQLSRL